MRDISLPSHFCISAICAHNPKCSFVVATTLCNICFIIQLWWNAFDSLSFSSLTGCSWLSAVFCLANKTRWQKGHADNEWLNDGLRQFFFLTSAFFQLAITKSANCISIVMRVWWIARNDCRESEPWGGVGGSIILSGSIEFLMTQRGIKCALSGVTSPLAHGANSLIDIQLTTLA